MLVVVRHFAVLGDEAIWRLLSCSAGSGLDRSGSIVFNDEPSGTTSRHRISEWPPVISVPTRCDNLLLLPQNTRDTHFILATRVDHFENATHAILRRQGLFWMNVCHSLVLPI